MKNFAILLLLLVALAGGAYFLISVPLGETVQTDITVAKGLVGLSDFDETCRPVFRRLLKEGDSVTVSSHPKALMDELALAAPTVMTLFYEEVERTHTYRLRRRFTRLCTEEDFRRIIAPTLVQRMSLSDINISIGPSGFRGSATKKIRGLPIPLGVRGRIAVDRQHGDRLYLKLDEVSVGLIPLPESVRTHLELEFQTHLTENPPVKIIDIEYAGEAIFVTCKSNRYPVSRPNGPKRDTLEI